MRAILIALNVSTIINDNHVLSGARTGIMAPGYFFNSTLAAPYVNKRGQWLNAPEAVLYGISGGLYRNILVSLDSPVYDETTQVQRPQPLPVPVPLARCDIPGGYS